MRHRQLSRKLARLAFTAVVSFLVTKKSFALECKKDWGDVTIKEACTVALGTEGTPSQIHFPISQWNSKTHNMFLSLKIKGMKNLEGLEVRVFSESTHVLTYTLPLYSDPEYNIIQDDIWTELSLPLSQMTLVAQTKIQLFDQIALYLKAKPNAPVQLEIVGVKILKKPSKGRISVTFDDGYDEHFQAARTLNQHQYAGTFYVIPGVLGQKNYLTKQQVKLMHQWGSEIGSHHQTPVTEIKNLETLKSLIKEIKAEISEVSGDSSQSLHFAYPLGKYNVSTLPIIKKLFTSARLAGGGLETLPAANKHRLRVYNVTPASTPERLLELMTTAAANGDWLILMFHYLDQPDKGDLNYSSNAFSQLIKSAKNKNLPIQPVGEVLKSRTQ